MNNAKIKGDEELRKEIKRLVEEIKSDHIKQPANRKGTDYYPTKNVFLKRKLSETSHKKWYDRERHNHMREALLEFYNNLNPNHEIQNIELIGSQELRPNTKYPDLKWDDLACYAALIGIEELKTSEIHDKAQSQPQEGGSLETTDWPKMTEVSDEITFEHMAALIAKKKQNTTLKTITDTLERLCRERRKELEDKGKNLPIPLYKKGSFMRDIYLKRFDDTTGKPLFQRMVMR